MVTVNPDFIKKLEQSGKDAGAECFMSGPEVFDPHGSNRAGGI